MKVLWQKKWLRNTLLLIIALITFIVLNNTSFFVASKGRPFLLAHRGLSQTFRTDGLTNETCTAERIYPPEHPYIENTLASMQAAFDAGADMVEFDIQPTKDGKFAIFHDWTLNCRTNGTGVTRDYTLADLQKWDIGYGYTADGGKTYPFRGKGIHLMPSLDDVLAKFPERQFLVHIKSNDANEGRQLATYLSALPVERLKTLTIYGGDEPVASFKQRMPGMRVMSKATLQACLIPYFAIGWTGYIPDACSHTQLHIPEKYAPWLWGWPTCFLERMASKDTRVIIVGGEGDFSTGFDTPADLKRLPANYSGGIWTNRIDRIAPVFHAQSTK